MGYCCYDLNHCISFFPDKIEACCSGFQGPMLVPNPSKSMFISWGGGVFAQRDETIEMLKNGTVPQGCIGCPQIKPYRKERNKKITKIILNHFIHCNCKCIYCTRLPYYGRNFTEKPAPSDFYDILPILKSMDENNLVDWKNTKVEFQGGDIGVLSEFEDILDFLFSKKVTKIVCFTNNINYFPKLEKILKYNNSTIVTALDAGCRETYKKIKGVDKFNRVIENIQKYRNISDPHRQLIKYILIENFNDNYKEVEKFLDIVNKIDIREINLEINYLDFLIHKEKKKIVPKHYYDILKIFQDFCSFEDRYLIINGHSQNILNRGYFG